MEPLPVVLVALLALYMMPFAFGLECYANACNKQPEIYGGTKCESSKAENITCNPLFYNRCMTANYTMSLAPFGSTSFELRNCSNSLACDPNSQWNTCKLLNVTGMLTDCSLGCCQGDLCNRGPVPDTTPNPKPASLECYTCSNQPELPGGTKCESGKAGKITCDPLLYNRCMTLKYTAFHEEHGSMSFELRNCTNSVSCDLDSEFYMCKMGNSTGTFTECSLDCCEGNLCNKIPEPTTKPQDQPTSEGFELVASFGAILFVFVLNMFA